MSNVDRDTPELARYYDRISDVQFRQGLELAELMKIGAGDSVLDIGCGTGRLALHVAGIVGPAGYVTGVDPSPHRVSLAKSKLAEFPGQNVCFSVGEGENLGLFRDESFDYAYYCAVFHWIANKEAALREAYRVLKPGGKVGLTSRSEDNSLSIRGVIRGVLARHPEISRSRKPGTNSMWASGEELKALLSSVGFTDITMSASATKVYFQSPKEYFGFLKASSFGQLSRVPEYLRPEIREAFVEEMEKRRTPLGIEIESHPLLAIATKPG